MILTPQEATCATLTARNRPEAPGYQGGRGKPENRLPQPLRAVAG